MGSASSLAIAFSRARRPAYCFARRMRFLLRSIILVFAINSSGRSTRERHVKGLQQGPGFGIGLGRGDDDDVHATDRLDLVVVDLRKHDLLLEAKGVVAPPVEAL